MSKNVNRHVGILVIICHGVSRSVTLVTNQMQRKSMYTNGLKCIKNVTFLAIVGMLIAVYPM